jgi:acyl-coenzyme A thioesterase PaaI-like protein
VSAFWTRLRERLVNFYPPMLGAGIRSRSVDERTVDVEMKLTAFNRNIVGVHFGGSLYAMCDPWFMLILMHTLGRDYIVWDKAAGIRFVRPGRGTVRAHFHIPQSRGIFLASSFFAHKQSPHLPLRMQTAVCT